MRSPETRFDGALPLSSGGEQSRLCSLDLRLRNTDHSCAQVCVHEPGVVRGNAAAQGAPERRQQCATTISLALPAQCVQDSWAKYLKEGMNVNLLTWNGKVIDVEVPNSVVLKVGPARKVARASSRRMQALSALRRRDRLSRQPAATRATPSPVRMPRVAPAGSRARAAANATRARARWFQARHA